MWAKWEAGGFSKEPIGVRRSLSATLAGARAEGNWSVANFSFESANFAARSSMFRGCVCPTPVPVPAPRPGLVAAPRDGDEEEDDLANELDENVGRSGPSLRSGFEDVVPRLVGCQLEDEDEW